MGPDSRCELCNVCGHIQNNCGSNPKCSNYSGYHRRSDYKCNALGCMAKQGSLCGHTLKKCPNFNRNLIIFSSRCKKRYKATNVGQQGRETGTAARATTTEAMHMAMGTNTVVLGCIPMEAVVADRGNMKEMMAEEEQEGRIEEARDCMMIETEIVTTPATDTETETEAGVLATKV